jgi:hypothetical protein
VKRRPPKGYATWSEYNRYRVERGVARGLSPARALGHPAKGERLASQVEKAVTILGKGGPVVVTLVGTKARSQAGKFDNDAGLLRAGKLSPATFDRRWKGKSIGGVNLPSANEVLALAHRGLATFDDFYPKAAA